MIVAYQRDACLPIVTTVLFAIWSMDKGKILQIHVEIVFSHKDNYILSITEKNRTREYCTKWTKSDTDRQISQIPSHTWMLKWSLSGCRITISRDWERLRGGVERVQIKGGEFN